MSIFAGLAQKRSRPPKLLAIGGVTALLGTNLEIGARCMARDLVGHEGLRTASLAGWSSIWMLPIYGCVGVLLGALNERLCFARQRMIWQCLCAGVLIALIELATGCLLNRQLGLAIWDYTAEPLNLYGQICLTHSLLFAFGLAPFTFWLDAEIRWAVYGEPRPQGLWTYYRLFRQRAVGPAAPL